MPTPAHKVELRPAFEWTCDNCGQDNFCRAIVPDIDMLEELKASLAAEAMAEGWDGIEPRMAPDSVTCLHCQQAYENTHREDLDSDI